MEAYAAEVKETPFPLIAALGSRELQAKVLQHVRAINDEYALKLHFTSLPLEHRFPVKKEVREKHGTFPNQTLRDFDAYRVQGILKTRWMKKHHECLPAVVLLFHEFDPRWMQKDWMAQETAIKDEMEQLKRGLAGRECRVLLILVQQIDDVGVAPMSVTEERLSGLRRRVEVDSKGLLLLRSRDITRGSSVLAKLEATVRNHAVEYYKAQAKRVKRYKKALNKTTHLALHVRHSFKIAHYYEFRRYTSKVLQHYEAAYRAITAMPLQGTVEKLDGIGIFQIKTMAEYIHFKLCYHLIFSTGSVRLAVEQLERHLRVYGRAMGPVERAFEHWEWVSRQYHVFAQLLCEAASLRGGLPGTGLESDVYKEPYLYFSLAAKYATYRREAAEKLGLSDPAISLLTNNDDSANEFVIVPSIFVGGDPVVSEARSPEPSYGAFVKYRYSIERKVSHAQKAIQLIELAIHHLCLFIGDRKVPRNRLKNRLLVQLGIEHLACNDLERARGELQTARQALSNEYWWTPATVVLRHLQTCTFFQGDIAAYIEYTLQLLSPLLDEQVSAEERLALQKSFEQAWRNPASLGSPFAEQTALHGYELGLNRLHKVFDVAAQFDRIYACIQEEVNLVVEIESHFPARIVMSKLELLFDENMYDICIHHRDGQETGCQDNAEGDWYSSLVFEPGVVKVLRIPLRILEGREMLRYRETRFFMSNTPANGCNQEYLVLVLPVETVLSHRTKTPRPYLVDGRVPVMGKGPGSPSFARRKSMFSIAEVGRSHEQDGVELVEEDVNLKSRGNAIAILQPRAKAKVEMMTQHPLLVGDFRVVFFKLISNEDSITHASFRVISEPAPTTVADSIFYVNDGDGGALVPTPLDENLQPRERVALEDMEENTEQSFSVIIRSAQAAPIQIAVLISYTTKAGVEVELEDRYELACHDPFIFETSFIHDFPNGASIANNGAGTKASSAVVGKTVSLNGLLSSTCPEALRILSMSFQQIEHTATRGVVALGFGDFEPDDESEVMNEGDSRSCSLRLLPLQPAPFVSLGSIEVTWCRLSSVVPTSEHQRNDIVSTWLDVPTVSFVNVPLTIDIEIPSCGIEGMLFTMAIRIKNNENAFHSVRIRPFDETGDFLVSGRTNAVEDLLPLDSTVAYIGLVPTKTGYLRLPQVEITSITFNMPFANSNERRELFVFPRECADGPTLSSSTTERVVAA